MNYLAHIKHAIGAVAVRKLSDCSPNAAGPSPEKCDLLEADRCRWKGLA